MTIFDIIAAIGVVLIVCRCAKKERKPLRVQNWSWRKYGGDAE